jgi:hypothetical protein
MIERYPGFTHDELFRLVARCTGGPIGPRGKRHKGVGITEREAPEAADFPHQCLSGEFRSGDQLLQEILRRTP